MEAAWENVSPELKPLAGSRSFPSVRYSACAVAYAGQLVVTHGYFYNHAIHHPAWQSDAWTFDTATKNWQKVHEGERAGAPSARYSTSCVVWDDALWMYGGDDGGHKRSMFNYVFGAHFSEMWRMDLRTFQWRKVNYAAGAVPPKRALHAACVIGSAMYVYGGLELSDTWRFDFPTRKWQLLAAPLDAKDPNHPNAIEHPAHPGPPPPPAARRDHAPRARADRPPRAAFPTLPELPELTYVYVAHATGRPTARPQGRRGRQLFLRFRRGAGERNALLRCC